MKPARISAAQAQELVLAIGSLVRRARAHAPAELREFSWTQIALLSRLAKAGPATSAELARAEGVTPQSMGAAIAALEEMGLVERKPHATDGRQLLVSLSARGAALRAHTKAAKETWLAQALERLDQRELAILFEAGAIMKRMAEQPEK